VILKDSEKELIELAVELAEKCRVSQSTRSQMCETYARWLENGTAARDPATANLLYGHRDRLASHLMSPTDLRFVIDFENEQPKEMIARGAVAARVLSREWERQNIDMMFSQGVNEALGYGAVFPKILARTTEEGNDRKVYLSTRLVMPWNFGVLNESVTELGEQEAVCETAYLTAYEVWRRVAHLPDGQKLYDRIIANASPDQGTGGPDGFMHQMLLGAVNAPINPSLPMQAAGLVDVGGSDQTPAPMVQVAEKLYPLHEIWVKNDALNNDYTMIQFIEPDILIAPRAGHSRKNALAPDTLPYGIICPNQNARSIWGRSEIADLMEPQKLLTGVLDDVRKLIGIQFDKLIGFTGQDGITDELYNNARKAGYVNLGPNSSAVDLTPKLPPEALPFIQFVMNLMDKISGFSNIMSGSGEPGVRAGVHADTLMRTASPRLRDRSLLVERQCASFADATLAVLEAKEARCYWVDPNDGGVSDFYFNQLADDRRVSVDAHSTSPIYHDDNANLMSFGIQRGFIGGDSAIEFMDFPHKEILLRRFKEMEIGKQTLMKEHPEFFMHGKGRPKF
jgi:hypothetical protein